MHLVSFDPAKALPFMVDGGTKTERELFDAFWIIYKTGDQPSAETLRQSLKIRDFVEGKSVPGGSIKLAHCGACAQRLVAGRYDGTRTLPDGEAVLNLRIEDKDFAYIHGCFGKWQIIPDELKRYFAYLQDLFESAKSQTVDDIDEAIKKQRAVEVKTA